MTELAPLPKFEVHVTTLPGSGFRARLRPDEAELKLLANACGVTAFHEFEADLLLMRWRRDGVEIAGNIHALVEQPCIVTLEPVLQKIDAPLRVMFVREDSKLARRQPVDTGELVLDPDGDDIPESFSGDSIDVWPVVTEWLGLEIDLFPRSPGAELPPEITGENEEDERPPSPFAVLKALKPRND
ncbi:MAG: DUF177 domain-containing protein [Nitratireductor sp.]